MPPVGALMVKLMLVVEARVGLLATNVYPLPAVLTVRLLKVAMPFCGVAVHCAPCPPAADTRVSVTGFVAVVAAFPLLSSTATSTAGEIAAPTAAFEGCCRKANFDGELPVPPQEALMVKLVLVAGASPGLAAECVSGSGSLQSGC